MTTAEDAFRGALERIANGPPVGTTGQTPWSVARDVLDTYSQSRVGQIPEAVETLLAKNESYEKALRQIIAEVEPHPGIAWLATIARRALEAKP